MSSVLPHNSDSNFEVQIPHLFTPQVDVIGLDVSTKAAQVIPEDLIQELECLICKHLMITPYTLECGHSLCKDCLENSILSQYTGKSHQLTTIKCSYCQKVSFIPHSPNQSIPKFVQQLIFDCLNKDCQQSCSFAELQQHYQECEHTVHSCSNYSVGCKWSGFKSNFLSHQSQCGHKQWVCRLCKSSLTESGRFSHPEQCPQLLKSCKNQDCNFSHTSVSILHLHQSLCPYTTRKCTGSKCQFVGSLQSLVHHEANCTWVLSEASQSKS